MGQIFEVGDGSCSWAMARGRTIQDDRTPSSPPLHAHAESVSAAARLLESQVAELLGAMDVGGQRESGVEILKGKPAINQRIADALGGCRSELLTAQAGGSRDPETLRVALERDQLALARGAVMRTLYQHSARHDPATAAYVSEITAAGAEVRTFDEFFSRLIVVDRRTAFIPTVADRTAAAVVTHPELVEYLVDIFHRVWQRADPYMAHGTQNITTPLQDLIIRMLVDGETGKVIAQRLGISDRTFAKRITSLKAEYGVLTSFQLGYQIALSQARPRP